MQQKKAQGMNDPKDMTTLRTSKVEFLTPQPLTQHTIVP